MAIILITHDLGLVADRADRVVVMYAGDLVEEQPAEDLLRSARHPYTKALIGARPGAGRALERDQSSLTSQDGFRLQGTLQGRMYFHSRCASALNICKTQRPPLAAFGDDRRVSCHLFAELAVEAAE